MKIAVTSQNFRSVTGHAGRARRFLVYDVQPDAEPALVEQLDLPKELAMHDFHGDAPHPIDGVDVMLSEGFGEGFAQRMAKRGIIAATTDKTDPVEAVKAFVAHLDAGGDAPTAATCGCEGGDGHRHGHAHAHHHHHAHGSAAARLHQGARILGTEAAEGEKSHE